MATFAVVITTSAPSSPTVYCRVLTGTVAAAVTTVARTAMTAQVTVGATSQWELYVSAWDNTLLNPRVVYDDGVTLWTAGQVVANVSQGNSSALIPEAGSGGDQCTLTFTNLGDPIADADVWVTATTDPASVVAGTKQTDSQGQVVMLLNDGVTYYQWLQKDGVEPIVAREFTAVAD